jgi:hypothetical protein
MKERALDRLRRLNLNESVGGVEIIFAAFVDYTDITVGRRCGVWDDAVNLMQLE